MPKVRVHNFATSLDGYSAGPDQSRAEPLGVGGESLHEWIFATRYWRARTGEEGGDEGVDNDFLVAGDVGIGAHVMGRNMFGPVRGPWGEDEWKGWWGDDPPYHHAVFVLTHHAHDPIEMEGGTTFHFVTDGIESALDQALAAAGGQDVRIGGGAGTVRQYLRAGLIDELHLPIVPLLLGAGERLFEDGDDEIRARYDVAEVVSSPAVAHFRLVKAR
ncbi:MAG TPA: dihydrofolate reductase family protein [Acidimicrobiales bacterium]